MTSYSLSLKRSSKLLGLCFLYNSIFCHSHFYYLHIKQAITHISSIPDACFTFLRGLSQLSGHLSQYSPLTDSFFSFWAASTMAFLERFISDGIVSLSHYVQIAQIICWWVYLFSFCIFHPKIRFFFVYLKSPVHRTIITQSHSTKSYWMYMWGPKGMKVWKKRYS